MNSFALEIWDDESTLVTFYTVRNEKSAISETEKFFRRYHKDPLFVEAVQKLVSLLLDVMGEEQGAHPAFFQRVENRAEALPPSKAKVHDISFLYPEFPLRLFCYRKSEKLVILFNGAPKTAPSNQQSEDLVVPFRQANDFTRRIEEAFRDGLLQTDDTGRIILDFQNNNEIFL
jgi:hypothetical protein